MGLLIGYIIFLLVVGCICFVCIRRAPSDEELWGDDSDTDDEVKK
ncbi:hypothetical protein [uncultured Bacteroides sp.]|nr:hypothetical protein [uncultured Bacteroides sp.]